MSKTTDSIRAANARGEKAMGLFVTNGFPDPASTLEVLLAASDGGADFIELGMPFSDPLAEGLPIQRSSARALAHGVKMADAFTTAEAFAKQRDTPLLLMGYANPVMRYGIGDFCRNAASSGVDALILPDVPLEEAAMFEGHARDAGLASVYLIAPNTPDDRVRQTDERADAFVYAVSVTGLTGTGFGAADRVSAYLQRARGLVQKNPLLVGFGIKTPEDAARLSEHTNGFIVGSALVDHVAEVWDGDTPPARRREAVEAFARRLKSTSPQPA